MYVATEPGEYVAVVRLYRDADKQDVLYETNVDFTYQPGFLPPRIYAVAPVERAIRPLLEDQEVKSWQIVAVSQC